MDYIIEDKDVTRAVGEASNCRIITQEAEDKMFYSREVYNPENYLYDTIEVLHETFSKDKMVINGRDNPIAFHGNYCKFRVF